MFFLWDSRLFLLYSRLLSHIMFSQIFYHYWIYIFFTRYLKVIINLETMLSKVKTDTEIFVVPFYQSLLCWCDFSTGIIIIYIQYISTTLLGQGTNQMYVDQVLKPDPNGFQLGSAIFSRKVWADFPALLM